MQKMLLLGLHSFNFLPPKKIIKLMFMTKYYHTLDTAILERIFRIKSSIFGYLRPLIISLCVFFWGVEGTFSFFTV